jgi:hypothetical protein
MTPAPPEPLLTVRAALVLLLAVVIGLLAGGLSYLADNSVPSAILRGGAASAAATLLFHKVIG